MSRGSGWRGCGRSLRHAPAGNRSALAWRIALLDECVHAFAALFAREARRDDAGGELVGLVDAEVHLLVERPLARRHRGGRLVGNFFSEFIYFRIKLTSRYHGVDEAPFEGLARLDEIAGEQH